MTAIILMERQRVKVDFELRYGDEFNSMFKFFLGTRTSCPFSGGFMPE